MIHNETNGQKTIRHEVRRPSPIKIWATCQNPWQFFSKVSLKNNTIMKELVLAGKNSFTDEENSQKEGCALSKTSSRDGESLFLPFTPPPASLPHNPINFCLQCTQQLLSLVSLHIPDFFSFLIRGQLQQTYQTLPALTVGGVHKGKFSVTPESVWVSN